METKNEMLKITCAKKKILHFLLNKTLIIKYLYIF